MRMTTVDSIPFNFIIYGYLYNQIFFSTELKYQSFLVIPSIKSNIDKISCKFIEGEYYACAIISIFDSNPLLEVHCLKYKYNDYPQGLTLLENDNSLNSWSISVGLYDTDTDKINIKLLCEQDFENKNIKCKFIQITINQKSSYQYKGDETIDFSTSIIFTEKNCNLSVFNNEYLFCCGIEDYIICYRIEFNTFKIIKKFTIEIPGENLIFQLKLIMNAPF